MCCKLNTFSCALKVLGSRGEAEKERELEAAAEKERLKAAAKSGALFCASLALCTLIFAWHTHLAPAISPGSSKRPPQGPRKEPRAAAAGSVAAEGADVEDDIDSDEEKRLRATDLGNFPGRLLLLDADAICRFDNGTAICGRCHFVSKRIHHQK